jgi:hypothetical protein
MKRRVFFKVGQNRVLVPVGKPCPFGCRYCYTRGGEVGLTRVEAEDILLPLQEFARHTPFETIQFGYDGDPFARPEPGLAVLSFVPPDTLETVPRRTGAVPWSAHVPMWTRYGDPERLQRLTRTIERLRGRAFLSSADAVRLAHQGERAR